MSTSIPRRDWLRQSSLALAGLTFAGKLSANTNEKLRHTVRIPADGAIRLTSNENPYGPSPLARKAMAEAITISNRYPWDNATVLREQIAKLHNVTADHVLLGAGSSEILGLVAALAARTKGNVVTADPSFQTCTRMAERLGMEIIRVPLSQDKKLDLNAMRAKLNNETRLVYVCNPNNPTGTTLPSGDVKNFISEASGKCPVLLDEAYIEYSDQPSLASMITSDKNVIVAKTFSKIYGLAGARIGYALAHPDTITQLGNMQPWQNAGASAVSVAGAMASLNDHDFVRSSKQLNKQAGAFAVKELTALGMTCIPSDTNFLYYSLGRFSGNWPDRMREKNVLALRIIEENGKWTRITVGTMEEMQAFIAAAKQIV